MRAVFFDQGAVALGIYDEAPVDVVGGGLGADATAAAVEDGATFHESNADIAQLIKVGKGTGELALSA